MENCYLCAMSKAPKTLKFEEALSKLEGMIRKLEEGNLPLDESISIFEEGMGLAKVCEEKLGEAEGKVEMLIKNASGSSKKVRFTGSENQDE